MPACAPLGLFIKPRPVAHEILLVIKPTNTLRSTLTNIANRRFRITSIAGHSLLSIWSKFYPSQRAQSKHTPWRIVTKLDTDGSGLTSPGLSRSRSANHQHSALLFTLTFWSHVLDSSRQLVNLNGQTPPNRHAWTTRTRQSSPDISTASIPESKPSTLAKMRQKTIEAIATRRKSRGPSRTLLTIRMAKVPNKRLHTPSTTCTSSSASYFSQRFTFSQIGFKTWKPPT